MKRIVCTTVALGIALGFGATASAQVAPPTSEADAGSTAGPAIRLNLELDEKPTKSGFVKSYPITSVDQLTAGNLADAFLGDVVLENDRLRAVIARPDKPEVGLVRGGTLIDVTHGQQGVDYLGSLNTTADPTSTGSTVIYTEILPAEVQGNTSATLTLQGYVGDTGVPRPDAGTVDVTTQYSLAAGSNRIKVRSTFSNETTHSAWLRPADVIDWGEARAFTPGTGFDTTTAPVHFALGAIDDFAMGYYTSGLEPMEGYHQGRDSVILAAGKVADLNLSVESRRSQEDAADESLPLEFKAIGASTIEKPGMVMFPGTETRYVTGMTGTPMNEPIYVPKDRIRYEDGKATITMEATQEDKVFAEPAKANASYVKLAPGEKFTFTRYLVVTGSNWATIANSAYEENDSELGTLAGAVLEMQSQKPIVEADVRISGGPDWDGTGTAPPVLQVKSREDGTFVANVPPGKYLVQVAAIGRRQANAPQPVTVTASESPVVTAAYMSGESILRIAISEAETPTSSPLPVKVTILSKPPYPTVDYGFTPDVSKGIRNTFYLPQGAAVMPLTPGRYRLVISRGVEYDILEKDIALATQQEVTITGALPHVMKGLLPGMVSMDAGIATDASAVGYAKAETRAIQAACEGVQVIVSGDYGQATDLQKAIRNQGLERWVRAFAGRRVLLHKDNMSADLFVYPLDEETSASFDKALAGVADLPPDIAIADLKKLFPNLIFEISRPTHPEFGYMKSFPYDEKAKEFKNDIMPPPDFTAFQILEGKKIGQDVLTYEQYIDMQMARLSGEDLHQGPPLSPVGSSFSRLPYGQEVGYPRMYLYLDRHKTLENVTASDIVSAVRGQHFLVTNGPILLFDALDYESREFNVLPGEIVDLSTTEVVRIRVRVLAAPWVSFYGVNTRENGLRGVTAGARAPSTDVLRFPTSAGELGSHIYTRYLKQDTVLDAYAYSQLRTLDPVVPDPLEDFGGEFFPYAWSGPIFVDRDGDGKIIINRNEP